MVNGHVTMTIKIIQTIFILLMKIIFLMVQLSIGITLFKSIKMVYQILGKLQIMKHLLIYHEENYII
jgi:hypothetical protein